PAPQRRPAAAGAAPCTATPYTDTTSVSLTGSDGDQGAAAIRYTLDGTLPTASAGLDYAGPIDLTQTTTLRFRAIDAAGNAEAVHTQIIAVDTAAPQVAIPSPGAGPVRGAVTLAVGASDDTAVDHVDVRVGDTTLQTLHAPPYVVTWDTTTAPDGPVDISAVAVDAVGRSTTSAAVTL